MKKSKKLACFLMGLVLLTGIFTAVEVNALAADEVALKATLDKTTINESSEAQTVKLTIAPESAITVGAFNYTVTYPSGWTLESISNDDSNAVFTAADYNKATGKVLWVSDDAEDYSISKMGIFTFTVPANTDDGEYDFNVSSVNASKAYGTVPVYTNATTASATLTILSSDVASTDASISGTATVSEGGTSTLTASLLPSNTTETIESVTWSSGNENVATVDTNGVVTGIAAGDTTITANITTSADTTYTKTYAVNVTASPYTVSAVRSGEGTVYAGDAVLMNVGVSGAAFDGAQLTLNYDSSVFEYASCSTSNVTVDSSATGKLKITAVNASGYADGTIVAALNFTAKAVSSTTTAAFGFDAATASTFVEAKDGNSMTAKTSGTNVTVTKQYTVKFNDKDGTLISGASYNIDQDDKVTTVPDSPNVDYYTFDKWSDGTNSYTAEQIKGLTVTADITYTATYTANSYAITLSERLTGEGTGTYNTNYTGTINNYDGTNYDYTVKYTVGETTKTAVLSDSTFTIPGTDITGSVSVTVSKLIKGVTIDVKADYITGYSLILLTGDTSNYSYDGHDMYYVNAYNAYAYIVSGTIDTDTVKTGIEVSTNAKTSIAASYDVNQADSGKVDFNDALCVFGCYNVKYTVSDNIPLYLRADVDGSYKIDSTDMNLVMTNYA